MSDTEKNEPDAPVSPPPSHPAPEAPHATNGNAALAAPAPAAEPTATSEPTVRRGNPLQLVRGGLTALGGGFVALALMALDAQYRWGVPVGILAIAVATFGVLDLLGTFDDPDDRVLKRSAFSEIARPLGTMAAALLGTLVLIGLTVHAVLPIAGAFVLVPAAFLLLIASVFQLGVALGPLATDETGQPRPLLQRHGFWVLATGTLLYLPMQGSYSLSDPWETHYGEVAREMLSRNDWISTWWAQDGWFWSKPVLDFWMQGLAMGIFGVAYKPGEMLVPEHGRTPWPEWAVRMPVFVLSIVGLYFLYKGVSKVFGRRAGLVGALVLATMPQWFLLAHQTITDMPLVSTLSAAMGLLMLGMHTDPEARVGAYEVSIGSRKLRLTGFHLVFGVILMSALPEILYLCSRNVELLLGGGHGYGFRWHLDEFWSGSKGNCGLPGNEACNHQLPFNKDFQPALEGLMWAGILGVILWMNWGERRAARLYFLMAWYFAAVATMGKGPAGFGLPILVTLTYIGATRNWAKLLSVEILSGMLIIAVVALPWYVAMYMRHGQPFTDRLIFHDMYKRAMTHVHDTNEGDDVSFRFYIWQIGYAMYLWTGLVPAGLVWWARRRDDAGNGQGDVSVFLAMWFVFAFGLFTAMLTKFHHYIFPAVPPAAMLTGILVDRMLGAGPLARPRDTVKYLAGTGLGALVAAYGTIRLFPGSLMGFRGTDNSLRAASFPLAIACIAVGLVVAVMSIQRFGLTATDLDDNGDDDASRRRRHENLMLGGVGVAAAIVLGLVGRDMASHPDGGEIQGQARLLHLFTYNYRRAWPESLEFSGVIAGVTIFATGVTLLLVIARWRRHLVVMLMATALGWAAWGLDVYLVKAAPHWGQREVIEAYFQARKGPEEPIFAYQMNWKGENFYTGNQIPAFVSSGATFTAYVKTQQEKGVKTIFFVTEHGRTGSLKNELGTPKTFDTLTDKRVNNKFTLVKATFE